MIWNGDLHYLHGACNPIKVIDHQKIDAIVANDIGAGALARLNHHGIRVYRALQLTLQKNVALFDSSQLSEDTLKSCCGGHCHGSTCPGPIEEPIPVIAPLRYHVVRQVTSGYPVLSLCDMVYLP